MISEQEKAYFGLTGSQGMELTIARQTTELLAAMRKNLGLVKPPISNEPHHSLPGDEVRWNDREI